MNKKPVEPLELDVPEDQEDDTTVVTPGQMVFDAGPGQNLKPGDVVKLVDGKIVKTGEKARIPSGSPGKVSEKKPAPGHADILGDPLEVVRNVVIATTVPTFEAMLTFALDNGLWFASATGPIHPEDVLKELESGKKLWQILGVEATPQTMNMMRMGDLASVELVDPHRAINQITQNVHTAQTTIDRIKRRLGMANRLD